MSEMMHFSQAKPSIFQRMRKRLSRNKFQGSQNPEGFLKTKAFKKSTFLLFVNILGPLVFAPQLRLIGRDKFHYGK